MSDFEDASTSSDHSSSEEYPLLQVDISSSDEESIDYNGLSLHSLRDAIEDFAELEVFRTILETEAPAELTEHQRVGLLHAITFGLREYDLEPKVLRLLIQKDSQVTRMRLDNRDGGLLLHAACKSNAPLDTIQLLLELNPDSISQRDDSGWLPLHRACAYMEPSSLTMIELLISHYPEAVRVPVEDNQYNSELPLHLALKCGASAEIIFTLLDHYPDAAKHVTDDGTIALHYGCGAACLVNTASLEVIERLVELYPDGVHHAGDEVTLPLHCACFSYGPSVEIVKFLIDQYPDGAKTQDVLGWFPLHRAACHGSLGIVQVLVESYPDAVKAKDGDGRLALHLACKFGSSREVVEFLVDCYNGEESYCSGLSVVDNDGRIPLHGAALGRATVETMQLLLERYPKGTSAATGTGMLPLHIASTSPDCGTQRIRLLVESNPFSVLKTTTDGHTALQLASQMWRADHETVTFLLEKQNEAVRAIREAFDDVVDAQLGLPDLVVANIWSFVKPNLLEQGEEESDEEFEEESDDEDESDDYWTM